MAVRRDAGTGRSRFVGGAGDLRRRCLSRVGAGGEHRRTTRMSAGAHQERPCAAKTRDVAEELVDAAIGERVNEQGAAQVRRDGDGVGAGDGARAECAGDVALSAMTSHSASDASNAARSSAIIATPSCPAASSRSTAVDDARRAGARGEQRLRAC